MRRVLQCLLFVLVSGSLVSRLAAQERTHDITLDEYATVNTITEIAVSPTRKSRSSDVGKKRQPRGFNLMNGDTDGKGKPQLTKDHGGDRHPKGAATDWPSTSRGPQGGGGEARTRGSRLGRAPATAVCGNRHRRVRTREGRLRHV